MAQGRRPGGLTALAVLNFVFGGLGILAVLALFALLSMADSALRAEGSAGITLSEAPGAGVIYIALAITAVQIILMIASGVGYLGMKKFLGRTLGNVYALIAIAGSVFSLVVAKQGFGLSTIIGLIYPVLTLVLLNTVFKEDFVN
jgi:hypothetical protein